MATKTKRKARTSSKATLAKKYEPTERERAAMESYLARTKEQKSAPRMKVVKMKKGVPQIGPDHPDHELAITLLMEAIGTTDRDFLSEFLGQLANAGSQGKEVDVQGLNFMLAVVKGVEPKDQAEAMLAAQMAAVHNATMTFARRLNHVDNIQQQDSAERAFNKLARTFTTQLEALNRYRGKGSTQKMTVEHVHVYEGGQAVVGPVQGGGKA